MDEMDTDIGLLGPVEVRRDGVIVPVPNGRPAVMLAAVALRGGEVIRHDALASYLWPAEQPAHPRKTMQNYATRLRRAIGPGVVLSGPAGFSLGLDPAAVDVFRFRSLTAPPAARATPAEELERLRQAFGLWRGEPLCGLAPDALEREYGPVLTEEFLAATERANDLRLRVDDIGDDLVGSLRRLVASHPWRERVWAQLMLALYRQGRQGEALATFHQLAAILRDDLGIDPGAEVVQLHERLLSADPTLSEGSSTAVTRSVPRPAQLPPAASDFVGREAELRRLTTIAVEPGDQVRVALVSGAAGVGKTCLALQAAHAVRASFPDGQLFAHLHGEGTQASPKDVLAGFLRALGVHDTDIPPSTDERSALYRSLCAERRLLVVLDDAAGTDQVMPLVPGAPGCGVLVTSRPWLAMAADVRIDLDLLDREEATTLMMKIIGRQRFHAEAEAAERVLQACGGLPLAVRIAASRLATRPWWPIEQLADRLAGKRRLQELRIEGRCIRALFETILNSLEPVLAERFLLLGVVPGNLIDVEAAAAVWNVDVDAARASLEMLTGIRLLEPAPTAETYQWHDLTRTFATEHEGVGRAAARRGLLHYAIRSLRGAMERIRPDDRPTHSIIASIDDVAGRTFADRDDVHAWIHPHWAMLSDLAVRELSSDDGAVIGEAAGMVSLMSTVAHDCCDRDEGETVLRAVVDADVPAEAARFVASAWNNLATTLAGLGRYEEARAVGHTAIDRWRELGDSFGEAVMLNNMLWRCFLERNLTDAAELLGECVRHADVLPETLRARCLYNLAVVEVELDDLVQARSHLEQADAASRPEPQSVGAYRRALAWASLYAREGSRAAAMDAYGDALAVADAMHSAKLRAAAFVQMARSLRRQGADGTAAARDAAQIAHDHHHVQLEADALGELADAYEHRGDDRGATEARRLAENMSACQCDTANLHNGDGPIRAPAPID